MVAVFGACAVCEIAGCTRSRVFALCLCGARMRFRSSLLVLADASSTSTGIITQTDVHSLLTVPVHSTELSVVVVGSVAVS